jgi:hypothetical protein
MSEDEKLKEEKESDPLAPFRATATIVISDTGSTVYEGMEPAASYSVDLDHRV